MCGESSCGTAGECGQRRFQTKGRRFILVCRNGVQTKGSERTARMQRSVLIVGDELAASELIERTVNTAGMHALVLNRNSEAGSVLNGTKFDLVFLSFNTAAPEGLELARQVRSTKSNRTTPIVLISDDQ